MASTCTLASNSSTHYSWVILPLKYQSRGLILTDWVNIFTLCVAPLYTHLIAGVPRIVYLSEDRPDWRHRIGVYNPTSIMWRYFAITDRRIRARSWNAYDLAATNVYFWTPQGWGGSEALSIKSREYCVLSPNNTHTALLSWSTVKTFIITLQGASALYTFANALVAPCSQVSRAFEISTDTIFTPLALFGLLRLLAAFWLTDEFAYVSSEDVETIVTTGNSESDALVELTSVRTSSTNELLHVLDTLGGEYYHPPECWQSSLFRVLYLLFILGLISLPVCFIIPIPFQWKTYSWNITSLIFIFFYLVFLVVTAIIFGFYFLRRRNTTTIIPCVSSPWYQVYTGIIVALMLVLIVIASIETRKSPCGYYTTWPLEQDPCSYLPSATNERD